jgi:hypothetical protein
MFARFRFRQLAKAHPGHHQRLGKLEVSLVENHRAGGRVVSQHVAYLGSIPQEGPYGWKLTKADHRHAADWFWRAGALSRLEQHAPDERLRRKLINDIVKRIGRRPPKQ